MYLYLSGIALWVFMGIPVCFKINAVIVIRIAEAASRIILNSQLLQAPPHIVGETLATRYF
jgi:hypothetical protein